MADPGKSTVKTFGKIGLGLGIVMLVVCIGRLQGEKDSPDNPAQSSEVGSQPSKDEPTADDIQKAQSDLRRAKDDLKKAWSDVKSEFRKGFNGGEPPQSSNSPGTLVEHSKEDGKPDNSGVTVGDVVKEASSNVLTDERRSQVNDVVEAAKLFMTDEQKSNLATIKTNVSEFIKAVDDSMTEEDKKKLLKLKKGAESAWKLYKETTKE